MIIQTITKIFEQCIHHHHIYLKQKFISDIFGRIALFLGTGPVLSRFDRFYQIGPRTLKGPRASGDPLLYYEAQNRGKCHKLNQCLIWIISNVF